MNENRYEAVLNILSEESRWTKGAMAADADNNPCNLDSPNTMKYCVTGAMFLVSRGLGTHRRNYLLNFFTGSIEDWNDNPDTTYEDVIDLLKVAKKVSKKEKLPCEICGRTTNYPHISLPYAPTKPNYRKLAMCLDCSIEHKQEYENFQLIVYKKMLKNIKKQNLDWEDRPVSNSILCNSPRWVRHEYLLSMFPVLYKHLILVTANPSISLENGTSDAEILSFVDYHVKIEDTINALKKSISSMEAKHD